MCAVCEWRESDTNEIRCYLYYSVELVMKWWFLMWGGSEILERVLHSEERDFVQFC